MPLDRPHPPAEPVPPVLRGAAEAIAPGSVVGRWRGLEGGRTNRLWRVDRHGAEAVVVKLCDGAATPLFPNDPGAEIAALERLRGTGLAPRPLGHAATALGPVLAYEHVEAPAPAEPEATARALARLHALPHGGLRRPPPPRARLADLLSRLADPPARLREALRAPDPDEGPTAFLHGDPTPGNALGAPGGCVLIDWQCPAAGDPCDDLAILLSPAMRRLDGLAPLPPDRARAVLRAYGSPALAGRLAASWPMRRAILAAHCLWRAERGWPGAAEAAALEMEAMA